MADKKVIWTQKTASGSDTIYPRTTADQVLYNGGTIEDALDNIGTDLESVYVTLNTDQTITGQKEFTKATKFIDTNKADDYTSIAGATVTVVKDYGDTRSILTDTGLSVQSGGNEYIVEYGVDSIKKTANTADNAKTYTYSFPDATGVLALKSDIKGISITNSGSGNAVTNITVNGQILTVTKGTTFATTATATQSANGLMSSTDKKNLDAMWKIWSADDTNDKLVNKVEEVLSAFEAFGEGDTIIGLLADKADKTALNAYVTLSTEQKITGRKTFENTNGVTVKAAGSQEYSNLTSDSLLLGAGVGTAELPAKTVTITPDGIALRASTGSSLSTPTTFLYPAQAGTLALFSDIKWANIPDKPTIPTSLPPSGSAGGDLTGTYPNPTIGTGKVTEGKIAANAVTEGKINAGAVTSGKIGANAVTTEKIANGAVTDDKLNTTGVTAGTYSVLTVNTKGRVTAGAQLFTFGTSSSIPSTVPVGGFYMQEVE